MKKGAALFISMIMLIGLAVPAFATTTYFSIGTCTYGGTVYDSETFSLTLPVTVKDAGISSFDIELGELDSGELSLASGNAIKTISTSSTADEIINVKYTLTAADDITSGYCYLPVTITSTLGGTPITESYTVAIKTKNENDSDEEDDDEYGDVLRIVNFTVDSDIVKADANFKLGIVIQNTGDTAIYDVQVTVGATDITAFSVAEGIESQYIKVSKGTNATPYTTCYFKLHAGKDMKSGRNPLALTITYKTRDGATHTSTANAFIPIEGTEETSSDNITEATPVMIIEQYSFGESSVTAGSTFPLQVTFYNTSNIALENIKITLSDDKGIFTPANSSNTLFIESIPAKGRVTKTVDFTAKADTEAKSYTITVNCDYEAIVSKERKALTTDEVLAIPITQIDRFEAGEIQCWGDVMVGNQTGLYINFVNKGKSTIFNLSVSIEGDFEVSENQTLYVGNVESGTSNSFETYIIPNAAGTMKGTITFEYEDANNEKKTLVKELSMDVMEGYTEPVDLPIDDPGMIDEPVAKGLPTIAIVGIVAGCVVVAAVVVIIILKAKKRKKNRIEDEDEDI